jgi:hypothetical protein
LTLAKQAEVEPKLVKLSVPSDADIAAVVTKLSQRVIRQLRQLGYLEPDLKATIAPATTSSTS